MSRRDGVVGQTLVQVERERDSSAITDLSAVVDLCPEIVTFNDAQPRQLRADAPACDLVRTAAAGYGHKPAGRRGGEHGVSVGGRLSDAQATGSLPDAHLSDTIMVWL